MIIIAASQWKAQFRVLVDSSSMILDIHVRQCLIKSLSILIDAGTNADKGIASLRTGTVALVCLGHTVHEHINRVSGFALETTGRVVFDALVNYLDVLAAFQHLLHVDGKSEGSIAQHEEPLRASRKNGPFTVVRFGLKRTAHLKAQ